MAPPIGACVGWPPKPASPRPAFIASCRRSGCSPIAAPASSCRPIRSSSRSCATSSGCTSNPPDKALVLCLDEKSQIQALERTQPLLPLGFGYVEGVTHDDLRHGTTTLFAALDLLDGTVLAQCRPRHRHQEFLGFLRVIDQAVPSDLEIHVILDNYATHKHPKVKAWLAARPRWHLHFIPTYSSWLNLVERFFALISDKTIRRGSFHSVRDLVAKIDHFVTHYNQTCKPFVWTATAESILAKLQRLCSRINGTEH